MVDVSERMDAIEQLRAGEQLLRRLTEALPLGVEDTLEHSQRTKNGVAVVFVDLDGFKAINDRHGHAAGDEVLRLTAERMMAGVRSADVVGRLGGDEFLIVCPDVATPDVALLLANRIGALLTQTIVLDSTDIEPGASIGVVWTDTAVGCDAIVAIADEAMYESKRTARGPVVVKR